MRRTLLATIALAFAATTAHAQVRFNDFSFDAGLAALDGANPAAQLGAAAVIEIAGHSLEFGAATSADYASFSALPVYRFGNLRVGGGLGAIKSREQSSAGLGAVAAYVVPIAPRSAAALQIVGRGALTTRTSAFSLSFGVRLAPNRGGLVLGESRRAEIEAAEAERSWDAMIAQLMLLANGETSVTGVRVAADTIVIGIASAPSVAAETDIARIARVLNGSPERIELVVAAPDPVWVVAAVTAGGFPAERVRAATSSGEVTIRAIRAVRASGGSALR